MDLNQRLAQIGELLDIEGGKIRLRDEGTQDEWDVVLRPFRIAPIPVTASQFSLVSGQKSSANDFPVVDVTWSDAIRFCNAVSEFCGLQPCYSSIDDQDCMDVTCDFSANGFRLPTEAEWEFACRAGSSGVRYGNLDEIAWHRGNSNDEICPVGLKLPNQFGAYDMIGNVWEWCWDQFDPKRYGPYRVFRGGGFADWSRGCRASCRRKSHPKFCAEDVGFRIAASA